MSAFTKEVGNAATVVGTTSGVGTIGAGNALGLLGMWVGGALTSQIVQLWTQTAGSVTGTPVGGTMTLAANAFYRFPGTFAKGLTYAITNENTNITFFWVTANN